MPILVLSPRYTPDSNALWKAAVELDDWSVERLHSHRPPASLRGKDIAVYGEALFANIVADELGLALLEPPFDFLTRLPNDYLLRDVRFAALGEARSLNVPAFIKPAYDKSFDAQVYQSGKELPDTSTLPDDLPVLIAEPVTWELEFRCFVLERQIAAMSIYARAGHLARTEDGTWPVQTEEIQAARIFAEQFLHNQSVDLPSAFVLDIGKIAERGWAVVEANPAWASGIYDCRPADILPVLQRACLQQDFLTASDVRWIFHRKV